MKISLNKTPASALIEVKDATGVAFNQLITEALEHIHNKYKPEVQYEQKGRNDKTN